jgi:hypothetical protein
MSPSDAIVYQNMYKHWTYGVSARPICFLDRDQLMKLLHKVLLQKFGDGFIKGLKVQNQLL